MLNDAVPTLVGPYNTSWSARPDHSVYTGDCRLLAEAIPDESVDLIMTDPPWDDANWFIWLAEVGARILKPGGSLFSMCGKAALNSVLAALDMGLDYNWMCVGYQPQSNLVFRPRRIMEKWRPAVWYTKGPRKQARFVSDLKATNRDKRFHDWGQGESFFLYYMNLIPGHIVFEPFVGGGTTLAAAKILGRKAFGFELDEDTADVARARVVSTKVPLIVDNGGKQGELWPELDFT
jgi:hypothetical protein